MGRQLNQGVRIECEWSTHVVYIYHILFFYLFLFFLVYN